MRFVRRKRPLSIMSKDTVISQQQIENAYESLDKPDASGACFVQWLRSHDDIDTDKLSRRRLLTLYAEFCEYYDLVELTSGCRDRSLKAAGFDRRRLSTAGRPWVYFLRKAGDAATVKRSIPLKPTSSRKRGAS